jgi:hypothetical protein
MDIRQKKETILISWNAVFTLPIYENKKMNNLGRVRKGVKSFLKYFRKKGHPIMLLVYTEGTKRQPSANLKRHVVFELGYSLKIINTGFSWTRNNSKQSLFLSDYMIIYWNYNFGKAKQYLKKRYEYTFLNMIKNIWRNK